MKIQHLDQTITVAKYPKEAGPPKKLPWGTDLSYTFECILKKSLRDSIQLTYSLHVVMTI